MKFFAVALTAAAAVSAQSVNPTLASLSLFQALPSSLQAVALTNTGAAATEIASEFATGTPTWFTVLPTAVQSYFLAQNAPAASSTGAISSASSALSSASTISNSASRSSAVSSASSVLASVSSSLSTKASSASGATASSTSASAAGAAQVTGAAIAGIMGLAALVAM